MERRRARCERGEFDASASRPSFCSAPGNFGTGNEIPEYRRNEVKSTDDLSFEVT
jgi:hypothetical protein